MKKQTTQIILLSLLALSACNANTELTQPPTPQPSASAPVSSPEPTPSASPSTTPSSIPSTQPSATPSPAPSLPPTQAEFSFEIKNGLTFWDKNDDLKLHMYHNNQLIDAQVYRGDQLQETLKFSSDKAKAGETYLFQFTRQNKKGECTSKFSYRNYFIQAQKGLNHIPARLDDFVRDLNDSSPAYISGLYLSKQGQALADAKVSLIAHYSESSATQKSSVITTSNTDTQGHFYIDEISSGIMPESYTLLFEKEGYPRQEIEYIPVSRQCDFEKNHMRIEAEALPLAEDEFQFYFDTRTLTINPQDNVMLKMYVDNSLVDEALYLAPKSKKLWF